MTKDQDSCSYQSDSSAQNELNLNAKRLIRNQTQKQRKRRKSSPSNTNRAKVSIWSTVASHAISSQDGVSFSCNICCKLIASNKKKSTSNVITHYKIHHNRIYFNLLQKDSTNANNDTLESVVASARRQWKTSRQTNTLIGLIRTSTDLSSRTRKTSTNILQPQPNISPVEKQAIATILFACYNEIPLSNIGAPYFQGFIDVFGGRVKFSSKKLITDNLVVTYDAVCRILKRCVDTASTGSLTVDGWSAALGAPILGITWHFIDEKWNLQSIRISTLNTGGASKSGMQLCHIMEEVLIQSPILGSEKVRVFTGTSDNEPATTLGVDLLTNYVGSIRCTVHTIALAINDVFKEGTAWKKYMDHVNKVTTYFNQHPKANQLLVATQLDHGITDDRIQKLKHNIPTRWHSRLGAMTTYLTRLNDIDHVKKTLDITDMELPSLSSSQQNTLAEFIIVLGEVRRVARQLEADKYVTLSRAPRILRELYETLLILSGNMSVSTFNGEDVDARILLDDLSDISTETALPCRQSTAQYDQERDYVRSMTLQKSTAKELAVKIACNIERRLGKLWKPVEEHVALWSSHCSDDLGYEGSDVPDSDIREPRRVLLFHIAAVLDVNETCLDFLDYTWEQKVGYYEILYKAIVREAKELKKDIYFSAAELKVLFSLFHKSMIQKLQECGRRPIDAALNFWRDVNQSGSVISPVPFNQLARAALSSQASSASAERLFSDLGRKEGNQCQSILSGTLEMTALIRTYVANEIKALVLPQKGLLHPTASAFRRLIDTISYEIERK